MHIRPGKKMGSPQNPTEEQYKILKASGKLNMISSPYWKNIGKWEPAN